MISWLKRLSNCMFGARIRGEAALRESEARFRSLTQLSSDWFWEQDAKYRFVAFSGGDREDGWGKYQSNAIGLCRWELPGLTPVSGDWEEHKALLEARKPYRGFEYQRHLEDGGPQYVSTSGEPVFDADGKFKGYRGVATDITARKQREEELRRFRVAMDATTDSVYLVDRESLRYLDFNAGVCASLGLTREQVFALGPAGVLSLSREELARLYDEVIASGGAVSIEASRTRRDGSQVWLEVRRHAQHTGRGWMIIIVARDITERKQAEAARQESEKRYRTLVEWSPESVIVHRNGKLIYVNPAAIRLFGATSAQELLGKSVFDLVHPDFREIALARMRNVIEHGGTTPLIERRYLKLDGTTIDAEVQATSIVYDGEPAIYVVIRDNTARKLAEVVRDSLEAQLRESQKMEAIGTLAGGIAHDFNNILATVLGNVELARKDARANPLALESLEEIRKAGSRGRDLVEQILSFSRRQLTERRPVALTSIVEESARLLRATLPARLVLDVHCEANVANVLADATQIEQVLLNLATNAMQAMQGAPGRIEIRLDEVMLDAVMAEACPVLQALFEKHPGRTPRIRVSDDGQGMDPATLERIFEPFFTTKPVDEGTGLGLSVVHGIVRTHEGAILVESEPGKGASFTLYLPAAEDGGGSTKAGDGAPRPIASPVAGAGKRILYIDDDEALVFLVQRLLERYDFRVSGHTNQRNALDALRKDPAGFDLVVTDYNMPGMSGLDVAREVRAIRADLPVAVASGFIDETLRAKADGSGVRELIFKASTVEDFCAALQRLAQTVEKATPKA